MKHFRLGEIENSENEEGIILDNIFSIHITKDKKIEFMEDCDQWFRKKVEKNEAIEILQEAIKYIENNLKD